MATVNLGNLTFLTLVSDVSTPAQFVQYNGLRLTIPEAIPLPPLGEYSTMTASGITVYGATRNGAGGLEWLMTAAVDPDQVRVDAIPVGGWASPVARAGYLDQAKYLAGQGITGATLWPGLKNFYDWAQADLTAKGWGP
jgi:hypothetical protein